MDNSKPINSVSEALTRIADLTQKNLDILKTINESFSTRRSHLAVNVDGTTYSIPSFISLETRIDTMEHNLENILNAPLTGEAFVYHDGTTQKLELSGYSTTPNHLDVKMPVDENNKRYFEVEPNSIFKDFMNPNPFIHIGIASIPNTIKHVDIRKVIIKESATNLISALNSVKDENDGVKFEDWNRISYAYEEGTDYEQYDTIKRLPLRQGLAQGTYIIESIEDHHIDSNFEEHFIVTLDKELVYYVNNGTIQRDIEVGDYLVTNNDKVELMVEDVNKLTRTLTIKVMYGAYSDLQDRSSNNPDLYTLKYYHAANDDKLREFNKSKYINIPIEEDRYIMVFIAPINDTTNVQAPWGTGIFLDVDSLYIKDGEMNFRAYYDKFVNNIGDSLASITAMMDDEEQVSRLSPAEFANVYNYQPVWNQTLLRVTQINKHLNDAKSIKAIRNLYSQKEKLHSELDTVQSNIDRLNQELATLSFDDTTNQRTIHETNLREAMSRKTEITNTLLQVSQEIALQANESDVPIENAKYRIRGFIDIPRVIPGIPDFVTPIKIEVQYRYKCSSSFTGSAEVFGDSYIYSDWNIMESPYRSRVATLDGSTYQYGWAEFNETKNEPSFNQIDIPITQGETVDVRVRYIYNIGHPFAEVTSAWSPINSVIFPDELKQSVEILDIVTENNDEIKQRSLELLLDRRGLTEHIDDTIQDQTIKFKHKAENISSGFFTPERRVIPLSDKLTSMDDVINELRTEVFGSAAENLLITLSSKNNAIQLKPWTLNTFHAGCYTRAINDDSTFHFWYEDQESQYKPDFAVCQLNINIKNIGTYNMRLHSMFPGNQQQPLTPQVLSAFKPANYLVNDDPDKGVYMMMDDQIDSDSGLVITQRRNQFIYFRTFLEGSAEPFYANTAALIQRENRLDNGIPRYSNSALKMNVIEMLDPQEGDGLALFEKMSNSMPGSFIGALYPYPGQLSNICIPQSQSFVVIKPGESLSIPVEFVYWFQDASDDNLISISKNLASGILTRNQVQLNPDLVAFNAELATKLGDISISQATDNEMKIALKRMQSMPIYATMKEHFTTPTKMRNLTVTRMMAFDIRTSLFADPITYKFTVDASYEDTKGFKIKADSFTKTGKLPVNTVVPDVAITKLVTPTGTGTNVNTSKVNLK